MDSKTLNQIGEFLIIIGLIINFALFISFYDAASNGLTRLPFEAYILRIAIISGGGTIFAGIGVVLRMIGWMEE